MLGWKGLTLWWQAWCACKLINCSRHICRYKYDEMFFTNAVLLHVPNARQLANARVVLPLNLCHLAWYNIDFKRAKAPDGRLPTFDRHAVVTRR